MLLLFYRRVLCKIVETHRLVLDFYDELKYHTEEIATASNNDNNLDKLEEVRHHEDPVNTDLVAFNAVCLLGVIFNQLAKIFRLSIFVRVQVVHHIKVGKTSVQSDALHYVKKVLPISFHFQKVERQKGNEVFPKATIEVVGGNFSKILNTLEFRILGVWVIKNKVHEKVHQECGLKGKHHILVLGVGVPVGCEVRVDETTDNAEEIDDLVPDEIG